MNWSRAILAAAVLLALGVAGWRWVLEPMLRPSEPGDEVAYDAAPPRTAKPAPAPELPLPRLSVTARDAGVEATVTLRGSQPDAGCASRGTDAPLCPGQYDVRATLGNQVALATVRLQRGDDRHLDLALQPAATLDVLVLDQDRLPVDRARVTAEQNGTGFLLEGKTDSDGTLSLGPVPPSDWSVVAVRDGWAPAAGTVTAGARKPTTLQLGSKGALDGLVTPATAVKLTLRTADHVAIAEASTAAGAFHFSGIPAGKYELLAEGDDVEPHVEPVTVPASGPVTLKLSVGSQLEGTLRGATVMTLDDGARRRTVTVKAGAFSLRGLSPGHYTVSAGYARAQLVLDGGPARLDLVVPRLGGVIAGTCGIDGGHRLPGSLTLSATRDDDGATATTACDAGRFALEGLPTGFYALDVQAREGDEHYETRVGSISTGTRDVDVVVPGVAWFSYRLVDEAGQPLSAVSAREHFEQRDVPLDVSLPGRVPLHRTVALERGRDALLGDLVLGKGLHLEGHVFDAVTKQPIASATVSVSGVDTLTKADGTFASDGAPEGDVTVVTSHAGHVSDTRVVQAPAELGIELQRAARVVGQVVTVDGAAPSGEVWAISEKQTVVAPVVNGLFATPHLNDGHWLMRVVPGSGFDTVELDVKGPGDRAVSVVERAAGLSFEVAVVDREGSPTASDVLLVPRSVAAPANEQEFAKLLAKPALMGEQTALPARYRFANVPPGAYTLLANAHGRVWTVAVPLAVQTGLTAVRLQFDQVPYSP